MFAPCIAIYEPSNQYRTKRRQTSRQSSCAHPIKNIPVARKISYQFGRSQLIIEFGDITNSDTQVIVSSDDCYLSMSGGVSLAIRRAGGDDIALDAAKKIPAPLGSVVITTAGNLPAHYIFHVITRGAEAAEALPEEVLQKATDRCMGLVEALRVNSIAFPALGAGTAAFPLDRVAAQMAKVIASALLKSEREIRVEIYLYDHRGLLQEMDFIPFIARFAARVPEFADHKTESSDPVAEENRTRDRVFVSYSHKNREWLEKLQTMLRPLVRKNSIAMWDDTQIKPGKKWRDEITKALASAKVAVLLVSPEFLASEFIADHELPPLLKAAEQDGLTILWVYLSACLYKETELGAFQAAYDVGRPLDSLSTAEQNAALVSICQHIKKAIATNT
ncbi:MAG: TIR domain-containing protein [Deltaproteobacteria bacterium]|nr:TIR domain-containing protein [Deltaproteobacteria bacterium]